MNDPTKSLFISLPTTEEVDPNDPKAVQAALLRGDHADSNRGVSQGQIEANRLESERNLLLQQVAAQGHGVTPQQEQRIKALTASLEWQRRMNQHNGGGHYVGGGAAGGVPDTNLAHAIETATEGAVNRELTEARRKGRPITPRDAYDLVQTKIKAYGEDAILGAHIGRLRKNLAR